MANTTQIDKRVKTIRRQLTGFDYVCSGNLRRRKLICGKLNCRCKANPPVLHGPYYYWSRRHKGRLVQRVLTAEQAGLMGRAIGNYRKVRDLLRQWEEETARIIKVRG